MSTTPQNTTNQTTLPVAHARYHVAGAKIEVIWQNADAPGCDPHGQMQCQRRELPRGLNGLFRRCYEAEQNCSAGRCGADWIELTDAEMVLLGLKHL